MPSCFQSMPFRPIRSNSRSIFRSAMRLLPSAFFKELGTASGLRTTARATREPRIIADGARARRDEVAVARSQLGVVSSTSLFHPPCHTPKARMGGPLLSTHVADRSYTN